MQSVTFGPTSLMTTRIGLGGMPMSIQGRPEREQCIKTIHASVDAGVRLIDTADVYCLDDDDIGHNEALIAKAMADRDTSDVLLCTKGGLTRPGGAWKTCGRVEHLKSACEKSLAALGVDQIALYQLHAPDDDVPFADSVGALRDLRDAGKIAHVGLSNVSAAQIREANEIVPIASVQNRCNPFDLRAFRADEGETVIDVCEDLGLAFLAYSPVGGGRGHERMGKEALFLEVGARHGFNAYEVALAWLLCKSPVMFPIPGASRVSSAQSSARAVELELTDADIAEIDAYVGFKR